MVLLNKSSVKGKQKQEKSKVIGLELQEYIFDGVTPNTYTSKEEWLNTYRGVADKTFDETTKLYEEVRQFSELDVTLKTVRDHAKDTLSLAMNVGNKVSEVNVNLENIPTTDMIQIHRETSDIIYTNCLNLHYSCINWSPTKRNFRTSYRKKSLRTSPFKSKLKSCKRNY